MRRNGDGDMRAAPFAELSAPAGKLFAASQLSLSKARAIGVGRSFCTWAGGPCASSILSAAAFGTQFRTRIAGLCDQ